MMRPVVWPAGAVANVSPDIGSTGPSWDGASWERGRPARKRGPEVRRRRPATWQSGRDISPADARVPRKQPFASGRDARVPRSGESSAPDLRFATGERSKSPRDASLPKFGQMPDPGDTGSGAGALAGNGAASGVGAVSGSGAAFSGD